MGNCQAVDAAALVIQHPSGKIERLYSTMTASEVMRMNPGHYVSLIIPLQVPHQEQQNQQDQNTVRITQVKLLRPNETLTLGHAYRLITTQEVINVLRAKKHAKTRKPPQAESPVQEGENFHTRKPYQGMRGERQRVRINSRSAVRCKSWRPSLQSISESRSSTMKSCDIQSGSHSNII
ncbi:uncharacterized protein LOC129284572 [Prosopis cineraria]|uniref:uncharacterized protein LOC129284572 n=1 Tax=Prosopis cineraria TaxID=364024 RepID=UPI00240FAB1E|nr:uncharacterized protein LOC129284572 [Prosopis cineraria]